MLSKEVCSLESKVKRLEQENMRMRSHISALQDNIKAVGLQNRKLKHDNERYYQRICTLQDFKINTKE